MESISHLALGKTGELITAHYLQCRGFTILEYNYRKRYGEIDLIAKSSDTLVFVEVKTRSSHVIALEEVVTLAKQKKIIKVAKEYLARHDYDTHLVCRFDVALLDASSQAGILYLENAFT